MSYIKNPKIISVLIIIVLISVLVLLLVPKLISQKGRQKEAFQVEQEYENPFSEDPQNLFEGLAGEKNSYQNPFESTESAAKDQEYENPFDVLR